MNTCPLPCPAQYHLNPRRSLLTSLSPMDLCVIFSIDDQSVLGSVAIDAIDTQPCFPNHVSCKVPPCNGTFGTRLRNAYSTIGQDVVVRSSETGLSGESGRILLPRWRMSSIRPQGDNIIKPGFYSHCLTFFDNRTPQFNNLSGEITNAKNDEQTSQNITFFVLTMGTLVETDIDQFIRANKHKLEEEKAELNHYPDQRHVDRGGQNVSPGGRRQWDKNQGRPPRPAEEPRPAPQQETGLAFGNDNQAKRKQQLNAERQKEYNEMLAKSKPGAKVFDYTEVEKEHMAEKRREYNEYLLKGQHSRHIITPERGMFVGADQTDRDKQAREKMLAYKQELEQQQQQQLLYKARQLAHIPDQSSRTNQIIKQSGPPPRSLQGQGYTGDERVKDMPKDSTRRIEAEHGGQSKRPPIFAENGPNYNHDDGERVFYKREEQRGRERERDERVGHRERDGENYQRHNERRHFPPQEVMRSRSLSPPLRDRGRRSPQGERSQRYLEDLEKRQQVLQEEYRRQLAEEQRLSAAQQETGLPLGVDGARAKLEEERKREYNQYLAAKHPATDRSRASEVLEGKGATLNVGEYDDNRRRHLEEERHQEYVQQQQQGELRTGARRAGAQPDSFAAGLQISGKDSAEIRKIKARNEEYNEYMREKTERDRHRFDDKKPATQASGRRPSPPRGNNPKEFATLPGLHYTDSAEKRKMADRNREYNDFLKQKDQRKRRFSTPTYEEILDQKRREEELARQEQGGNLRRYASEGNINKFENEMRDRELNKEKVRFGDERKLPSGILDDDNWLHPDHREEEYHQLVEPPPRPQPEMATSVQPKFMGGLNVGNDERDSAKRRRQAEYRRELQFQMEETQARKKREKVQDLRVNASGLLDPEKTSNRIRGLEGVPGASPRREYKAKEVQPYHTRFLLDDSGENLQLDLGGGGGRERGRRRERDNPLSMDPGFMGLLESRRPMGIAAPPPGLMYQPSTYVTGGGGGLGGLGSVDEAYNYYAMKNPLEDLNGGGGGYVPSLNLGGGGQDYGRADYETGNETEARKGYPRTISRVNKNKRPAPDGTQKAMGQNSHDRYDQKLEDEIKNYNPFGRGGGGAPIRDEGGNAIADLRAVQRGTYQSPRSSRRASPQSFSPRPPSPRDDKIKPPPAQQTAQGESTYARGGHGIFGMPKTDAEKDASDKYKDELRDQMEKERERMEEERENKRLEDQRLRMQSEYEEEQKKIRAREEEARRKNEELKLAAEERKKEAQRKNREQDDAKMKQQQEDMEREKREREQRENEASERLKSPPVPAMKAKNEPDVFDPRTIQRPPPNKVIFENAVNKNASLPPPRPSTDTVNARNIQQFNELKYKTDTESRRALRSMFPEAPVTNNTLETQQEAMLRQQEEQLRSLRERNVDNINHFPEDFEDMTGARNDTARARRRERFSPRPSSINGMGSQASLDVDRIQLKNEDRLRRLHQMSSHPDVDIMEI
ncbi:CSPP1-like protein [Mya arenaria]|uniref:CSPP1-like protein n=1 Tax=Mya arenaria TaxID=6604 RepID=A0ABY7FQ90_MYAAR|nr:CSPP1-like protein [Mya arenaria]